MNAMVGLSQLNPCAKCGGTGAYFYDHNHAKPCESCCPHNQGWWQLTEGFSRYIEGVDNSCCNMGCGTLLRNLQHAKSDAPGAIEKP